jgi:uncharacterized membrane protein
MQVDLHTLLTIVSMALVTYLSRAGGYWLFRQLKPSPALQSVLSYVPGALFVSFVVPAVVSGGMKEWVGAAAAFAVARLTGSVVWPIVAGTAAAWVVWAVLGSS